MSSRTPVTDQLASSLGRRDEQPNIDLALKIVRSGSKAQVDELVALLAGKKAPWRHDAIKVLYEIGERKPELIVDHVKVFLECLHHKDNRMKWGGMTALSAISAAVPEALTPYLTDIVSAMDEGSVITRDHGIYILSHVAAVKKYHADCMELLLEQLVKAPVNQVPMYAEKIAEVITAPFIGRFLQILEGRDDVFDIPSKARRIEKVIKKMKA